jgi:hypothetical protein
MSKIATLAFMVLALSACKTMETADKKMQTFDKKVDQADAKFRNKVGLKPYEEKGQPVVSDSK